MRISDWSSDVCSSDLHPVVDLADGQLEGHPGVEHRVGRELAGAQHGVVDQGIAVPPGECVAHEATYRAAAGDGRLEPLDALVEAHPPDDRPTSLSPPWSELPSPPNLPTRSLGAHSPVPPGGAGAG